MPYNDVVRDTTTDLWGIFIYNNMITISNAFEVIENEVWKDVPNSNGLYQCSTYGRVKSRYLLNKNMNPLKSQKPDKDGYYRVSTQFNDYKRKYPVHQLVAMTFLNHTPNGMRGLVVNHINGIKTDNRLSNLELVTNRYNVSYAVEAYENKNLGVYKCSSGYYSQISINCKSIPIMSSKDSSMCRLAYDIANEIVDEYDGDNKKFRQKIRDISISKYNISLEPEKRMYKNPTPQQRLNAKPKNNKSSKYTGVSFKRKDNSFCAEIRINKIPIILKYSKDEYLCHLAYQTACKLSNKFDGDKFKFKELVFKDMRNNGINI